MLFEKCVAFETAVYALSGDYQPVSLSLALSLLSVSCDSVAVAALISTCQQTDVCVYARVRARACV